MLWFAGCVVDRATSLAPDATVVFAVLTPHADAWRPMMAGRRS